MGTAGVRSRSWPDWREGYATAEGRDWRITFAPAVIARLRELIDAGRAEIQWLTTWGHSANDDLRQLLGLPHLHVAGTYDDEDVDASGAARQAPTGEHVPHADAAPPAPAPLSGRWWKYDVVRRIVARDADRLVVWIDDELTSVSPFTEWAASVP